MVNAWDSGSRGWGSSPTQVKACCVLEQGTFTPQKVLVIPRKRWLHPNMTEKLFTGMLRINQPTNQPFYIKIWTQVVCPCPRTMYMYVNKIFKSLLFQNYRNLKILELCKEHQANLKNNFVSPYPTLFLQYGSVGRKIIFFNFSNSIPIKPNCK